MESALHLHRAQTPLKDGGSDRNLWIERYRRIRSVSEKLCEPLALEDYVVQPESHVSPPKWHLGHTTWFFEHFLLGVHCPDYLPLNRVYDRVFNSYYESLGAPFPRERRGTLSRPTVEEVYSYRREVDTAVLEFLFCSAEPVLREALPVLELGLHHEQQHQELLLSDIKYIFWANPLRPAYRPVRNQAPLGTAHGKNTPNCEVTHFYRGGLIQVGAERELFSFDNEKPRHLTHVPPFVLSSLPVTNGEYMEFIEAGAYTNPLYWHSDGWKHSQGAGWTAPLYWELDCDGSWWTLSFEGMKRIDPNEPVVHVSFFEASAYAAWKSARLPTEFEWEHAASKLPAHGNFLESELFHPSPAGSHNGLLMGPNLANAQIDHPQQLFGDVWEWTQSAYLPYPGFRPLPGALGEYNGKFMCNQMVLRGGSCATPASHIRPSYRNFFQPETRWQFSGFRLADQTSKEEL
jgi:ergothioneine biosynthesis protein EgtB